MRTWTPEEKAKQAEAIRRHKPWEKSTGPKTAHGKRRSSKNAFTGGHYTAQTRHIRKTLNAQKEFTAHLTAYYESRIMEEQCKLLKHAAGIKDSNYKANPAESTT